MIDIKIKNPDKLHNPTGKGGFQKGHTYSKGFGRPKGSIDSKRNGLMHFLLDKAESEWPALCKVIFDLALKGDYKFIALVVGACLPANSHIRLEVEANKDDSKVESNKEMIENMTMDEVKTMMAQIMTEHQAMIVDQGQSINTLN